MTQSCRVLVIGAGFGGIGMAIELRRAGLDDFVVLEKGNDVGGVWRDNEYPGAACDIPSHLYSFSFEPKPDWSRAFAPQAEILAYLQHCALKYDVRRHMRFGTEVAAAEFDEGEGVWRVTTTSGERWNARVVVTACGQLNRPSIPRLPGVDRFRGVAFHSARWDRGCSLAGKRVAIIGTGASAIQIAPSIIDDVERLYLFQRSAPYVIPKADRVYGPRERALLARLPALQRLGRAGLYAALETRAIGLIYAPRLLGLVERSFRKNLESSIVDPELRRKLSPDYPFGCKRVLLSNDYYPALARPNAEVVTDPIAEVTAQGMTTLAGDGDQGPRGDRMRTRAVDVIIYATGFKASEFLAPMSIRGRASRHLQTEWKDGAEAYLGMSVSGFPNLFMLYGPNTNLGHNSIIYMLESQIAYAVRCVQELEARRLRYMDVVPKVQSDYNVEIQRRIRGSIWADGCTSWYKTAAGKNTNNWPDFTFTYRRQTRTPNFAHYEAAP